MSAPPDPALETLFLPFKAGLLPWPAAPVLFLRARFGPVLAGFPNVICEQSFKPEADLLTNAGFRLAPADETIAYPLVLVLLPRQRQEARALLARAASRTSPGGRVVVCAGNQDGARSGEADLRALLGAATVESKHKCRVCWSDTLSGEIARNLLEAWLELDAPRPLEDARFVSRPGLFAWDHVDAGSRLLADQLPATLAGDAADLGAGFGYLSARLLERCPAVQSVDLYEAEARALALAEQNLRNFPSPARLGFHWHDVTQGLPTRHDVILTNPPFHGLTRTDRPDLGQQFIRAAADALRANGELWLVANRHLPYEALLMARFQRVVTVADEAGFKVLRATGVTPPANGKTR